MSVVGEKCLCVRRLRCECGVRDRGGGCMYGEMGLYVCVCVSFHLRQHCGVCVGSVWREIGVCLEGEMCVCVCGEREMEGVEGETMSCVSVCVCGELDVCGF